MSFIFLKKTSSIIINLFNINYLNISYLYLKNSELKIVENQLDAANALWKSKPIEEMISEVQITEQRTEQKREITNKISKEERQVNTLKKALIQAEELQNNANTMDQSIA